MSRISTQTLETAPEASRETLAALAKKMGKLLNIHAAMATSPVVLAAYKGINEAIAAHGTLDVRTTETIALAVGNENGCAYCEAAHTQAAKAAKFTPDQTLAIRAGKIDFDPKLDAIARVAREAAFSVGVVSDETWQAALDAGWSDNDLAEAFAHVRLNLYTNYVNHYAETQLDLPAAPELKA